MSQDQHTADVRSIAEENDVTLVTDDGLEYAVTCVEKTRHHSEGVNIEQQDNWYFRPRDDPESERYVLTITEGLSGTDGDSPYPLHFPLYVEADVQASGVITEENSLGYVTAVVFESEPTGVDPDGTIDTGV